MSATATLTEFDRALESDSGRPVQDFDALDPPITSFPLSTTMPQMFSSLLEELSFVGICSMGQMMFAIHLAQAFVNHVTYIKALETSTLNTAWLIGSFLVANGVSVVKSGSLADLINPKSLLCRAFLWLATWSLIGAFSLSPSRVVLFFIGRAMAGLAIGTLASASMSMLGRVYHSGVRKNRVFSLMGAMIPFVFAIGAVQGGALSAHLPWLFGATALIALACFLAAAWCIPSLPVESVSIKDFDFLGAACAMTGCGLVIFGLTQGTRSHWTPYTYSLVVVGLLFLVAFGLLEGRVRRPLIDNRLWSTPGFMPVIISYFLGYGAFAGAFHFYAARFLLTIQSRSPIIVGCCLIPVGVAGAIASWIVARTLHVLPGHYNISGSMLGFAAGPAFFLPQNADTSYWALGFPGFILSTLGPDMSFAATSIFITSNVPKSYQGAPGSLVITAQNLSTAILAAIGDTLGERVTKSPDGSLT